MPLYEYECPTCGRFERIQKFADAPLSTCPTCGSDVQKLLSAPAFQFKGTGWYITDYARKSGGDGKSDAAKGDKGDKGDGGGAKAEPAKSTSDTSSTSGGGTTTPSASPPAAK